MTTERFYVSATFLLGLLLGSSPALAAKVLSVGDGDTITVIEGAKRTKIRLACIDAPETSQAPYGIESRKAVQALLPIGTEVTFRVKAIDRYRRTVAEVFRGSVNVNQKQVESGNAFVYWQYIQGCDRGTYSRLENAARLKRAGIWSVNTGIERPWDYRHGRKTRSSQSVPIPPQSSGSGLNTTSKPAASGAPQSYRCRDLTYEKAQILLHQGYTSLDGDRDGVACESLRH